MATELAEIPGIDIDPNVVDTNIMYIDIEEETQKKLNTDIRKMAARLRDEENILCNAGFPYDNMRFVTHRDVTR